MLLLNFILIGIICTLGQEVDCNLAYSCFGEPLLESNVSSVLCDVIHDIFVPQPHKYKFDPSHVKKEEMGWLEVMGNDKIENLIKWKIKMNF